jgi:hypothetical protein
VEREIVGEVVEKLDAVLLVSGYVDVCDFHLASLVLEGGCKYAFFLIEDVELWSTKGALKKNSRVLVPSRCATPFDIPRGGVVRGVDLLETAHVYWPNSKQIEQG